MADRTGVTWEELRALAFCVADAGSAGTPQLAQVALARGLLTCVDAGVAVVATVLLNHETPRSLQGRSARLSTVSFGDAGWSSDEARGYWLKHARRDDSPPCPFLAAMLDEAERLDASRGELPAAAVEPLVRDRRELVTDEAWYSSAHVLAVRRPAGYDHCLYALLRVAPGGFIKLAVHRRWSMSAFDGHERQKFESLAAALRPLASRWGQHQALGLSEHLRRVHQKLVDTSLTERQVATELSLAHATVREYTKRICSAQDVRSRVELILRARGVGPLDGDLPEGDLIR